MPAKIRKIGPYSWPTTLAKVDGRTKAAGLMKMVREDLLEHVGGKPTVVQKMLIERAAVLSLRLATLDQKIIDDGHFTEHDSNHAIAWQNSLTRVLVALGVKGEAAPAISSLAEYLNGRAA